MKRDSKPWIVGDYVGVFLLRHFAILALIFSTNQFWIFWIWIAVLLSSVLFGVFVLFNNKWLQNKKNLAKGLLFSSAIVIVVGLSVTVFLSYAFQR